MDAIRCADETLSQSVDKGWNEICNGKMCDVEIVLPQVSRKCLYRQPDCLDKSSINLFRKYNSLRCGTRHILSRHFLFS